jgi:hypothetical protein
MRANAEAAHDNLQSRPLFGKAMFDILTINIAEVRLEQSAVALDVVEMRPQCAPN